MCLEEVNRWWERSLWMEKSKKVSLSGWHSSWSPRKNEHPGKEHRRPLRTSGLKNRKKLGVPEVSRAGERVGWDGETEAPEDHTGSCRIWWGDGGFRVCGMDVRLCSWTWGCEAGDAAAWSMSWRMVTKGRMLRRLRLWSRFIMCLGLGC